MTAHPLGRHVPNSRPLVSFAVEAVGGDGGELCVATHDEDLAAQDSSRRVAPRLGAFGRDIPPVTHGVVALDLDVEDRKVWPVGLECRLSQSGV